MSGGEQVNVLCVVAHPDDETLICGGTLAKHAEAGDDVCVFAFCFTRASGNYKAACETLGTQAISTDFPDQRLDRESFSHLVGTIEMTDFPDPDLVITHHPSDLNLDHELVARAVLTTFRPKPGQKPQTILAGETPSSTEYSWGRPLFEPTWFEALSAEQLDKKIEALKHYSTEVEVFPHPRSPTGLRNLAAVRGQQVGVERAEAFQLLRRLR